MDCRDRKIDKSEENQNCSHSSIGIEKKKKSLVDTILEEKVLHTKCTRAGKLLMVEELFRQKDKYFVDKFNNKDYIQPPTLRSF